MTKEELKNLVATKISGQGNQVDLGNALTTILNELIDTKPERAPITIDLSSFDLSQNVDISSVIPTNYMPQTGDKIYFLNSSFYLSMYMYMGDAQFIKSVWGILEMGGNAWNYIQINKLGSQWYAQLFMR